MSAIQITKSIFSQNMSDISVTAKNGTKCSIEIIPRVSLPAVTFPISPWNDKIILCTSDIVNNYTREYDPRLDIDYDIGSIKLDKITIKVSVNDVVSEFIIDYISGGYNGLELKDEYEFLKHNFLTNRPQITYTSLGIKELLSLVIYKQGPDSTKDYTKISRTLQAKVYLNDGTTHIVTLGTLGADGMMFILDCSLEKIASKISEQKVDNIVAYDVYGENDGDNYTNPQRFIVRPLNSSYSYFLFQNKLGGFDTITATGEVVSSAKSNIQTSIVRHIETEVNNNLTRSWEVNTGYIVSAQEENWWLEFLGSTNKYILFADGTYRKIIIEEYKAERTHQLGGSFTFKYHFAEPMVSRHFPKLAELDTYK